MIVEPTSQELKDTIAYLIMGNEGQIVGSEEDEHFHSFTFSDEGDGWNEPRSESSGCDCGWQGLSWVQIDPKCTGRPSIWEYALAWKDHILKDIWKEEDDERISQDTDAF